MTLAVITTYYNEVETIGEVVDAIAKTEAAFDLYLIDDCSTKPPSDVLERYGNEPWFHYLKNEKNMGPVFGLNRGIKKALENGATFIAINDSDDVTYDNRFPETLAAFNADPELMIVGGGADFTDHDTGELLWQTNHPSENDAIHRQNWLNSAFVHSTVTYRAEVFNKVGFYREGCYALDYDMITRVLTSGVKAANLPSIVLKYNVRENSMSVSKRRKQVSSRLSVQLRHFSLFNPLSWLGIIRSSLAYIAPNNAPSNAKTLLHKFKIRAS
ncbi:MAG: glycosyltransferase [Hyphomicrobiales bacterium]